MKQLSTPSEVVKALGGQTETGKLFDPVVSNQAVHLWCARAKFPAWTVFVILDALAELDPPLTAPLSLWGIPRKKVS